MEDENELMVEEPENVVEQPTEEVVDGMETNQDVEKNVDDKQEGKEQDKKDDSNNEKLYTEEELNARINEILPKKIAKKEAKIKREYDTKYGKLERTLQAALGTTDLEETIAKTTDYYKEQGVQMPEEPKYSKRDIDILGKAEADEIISDGYDEIVEETDRLSKIGIEKMTQKEKVVFKHLAEERKRQEEVKELASIGVEEKDINTTEFKEFSSKLNPSLSLKEKYEIYTKLNPKETPETIGSMKSATKPEEKDFYTPEEVDKLSEKDYNNPKIVAKVRKSMLEWGKKKE